MNVHPFPCLTREMAEWLRARDGRILMKDLVLDFVLRFDLDAVRAGKLLAQWAREAYRSTPTTGPAQVVPRGRTPFAPVSTARAGAGHPFNEEQ